MEDNIYVQLFIHLRECTPIHFYTKANEDLLFEEDIKSFFQDLDCNLECIQTEKYKGFYDVDNINAFLVNYDILDDYYPVSPRRKLRQSLKGWINWKKKRESDLQEEYKVDKNPTRDNSFGEIHERKTKNADIKYLLISYNSVCFTNQIVNVEKTSSSLVQQIECIELNGKLKKWFDSNRIPQRIYHASPKHGENGKGGWKGASKLLCSHIKANEMLLKAVGINGLDELYYYDDEHKTHIIFRYEGNIGENKFHAYHLSSKEIRDKTVAKILEKALKFYTEE